MRRHITQDLYPSLSKQGYNTEHTGLNTQSWEKRESGTEVSQLFLIKWAHFISPTGNLRVYMKELNKQTLVGLGSDTMDITTTTCAEKHSWYREPAGPCNTVEAFRKRILHHSVEWKRQQMPAARLHTHTHTQKTWFWFGRFARWTISSKIHGCVLRNEA